MATKSKNKGLLKDGSRSKESMSSSKDGCMVKSPGRESMNGDLDEEPQLWIHTPDDAPHSLEEKDRKRITHNVLERKRKDKIKRWMASIRDLLPKFTPGTEKPSHGEIMEKACNYIRELQNKNERLMSAGGTAVQAEEIETLRKQLSSVEAERDRLNEVLRNAGLTSVLDPSHQWKNRTLSKPDSTATSTECEPSCSTGSSDTFVPDSSSGRDDEAKAAKKRKNTVGFQLEQTKLQQQQLQEAAAAQAMLNPMGLMNPLLNPLGLSQQVLANQNLLMNPGFQNPGTVVMNSNGQMILPMSTAGPNGAGTVIFPGDKNLAASGLGLLQLAMQDAGIGPNQSDSSRQPSPACSTSENQQSKVASSSGSDTPSSVSGSNEDLNPASALQTLASVASNTQNAVASMMSPMPQSQASVVAQSSVGGTQTTSTVNSVMSLSQPNFTPMMQQGNMMVNMPVVSGQNPQMIQNGALGGFGMGNFVINQNGQVIMINEQGLPVMAGMPGVPTPEQQTLQQQQQTLPQQQSVPVSKPEKSKSKKSKSTSNSASSSSSMLQSAQDPSDPGAVNISLVSSSPDVSFINNASTVTVTASQTQPSVMPQAMTQQQNPMTLLTQQNALLQAGGMQTLGPQAQPQVSIPSMFPQQQLGGQLAVNQPMLQTQNPALGMTATQNPALGMPGAQNPGLTMPGSQNPGIAMPVSQSGSFLTLNTMPSQPNQLPSALILPNGQIIPVVTNAQTVATQQAPANAGLQIMQNGTQSTIQYAPQMQQRVGMPNTMITGLDPNNPTQTQMIIGPNGVQQQIQSAPQQVFQQPQIKMQPPYGQPGLQPGGMNLLLSTASSQVVSATTTNCATLSTSVVPTSCTQSVMSTQIQGSATATNVVQASSAMTTGNETSSSVEADSQPKVTSQIQGQTDIKPVPTSLAPIAPSVVGPAIPGLPNAGLPGTPTLPGMSGLVQASGGQAPVLLTVPVNGQQMNVLIDPTTMQVLAKLPTTQATPLVPTTTAAQVTTASQPPQQPAAPPSKKGKKNQRTICPKPSSKNQNQTASSETPISQASTTAANNVTSTTFSEAKPTSSVDTSTTSADAAAAATDILAKAAESIFSESPSEISPMASFYNPANEDNPLHIDTSVGEGEEETGSPSKVTQDGTSHPHKPGKKDMAPPPVPVIKATEAEPVKPQPVPPAPVLPTPDPIPAVPQAPAPTSTPSKKKKSKSKNKDKEATTPESTKSESKKSSSKKKKKDKETPPAAPVPPPPESDPKTLSMPDTIEFSASQLSDVLDQVENFAAEPVKKKSRKGKDTDGEPANKKRKKNSSKKEEPPPSAPQPQSSKGALSIYDFEEDSPPAMSPATPRRSLGLHNPPTPLSTPVSKPVEPPVQKEPKSAAENFDLLEDVLNQALPQPSSTPSNEKSPFTSPSSDDKKMDTSLAPEPTVQAFSPPPPVPEPPVVPPPSSSLPQQDSQVSSKPSPVTASSSDDHMSKPSSITPNMTPKSDLMENAVSSSMLSPASAGSAQGTISDMVGITSSVVDPLAELTASPAATPSPGALIMGSSPSYPPSLEQPQSHQSWQSPTLQQSPSQSLQTPRPPSHSPIAPPLQQSHSPCPPPQMTPPSSQSLQHQPSINNTSLQNNQTNMPSQASLTSQSSQSSLSHNQNSINNQTSLHGQSSMSNPTSMPNNQSSMPNNQSSMPSNQSSIPSNQTSIPSNQSSMPGNQSSMPGNQSSMSANQSSMPTNQSNMSNPSSMPNNQSNLSSKSPMSSNQSSLPSNQSNLSNPSSMSNNQPNMTNTNMPSKTSSLPPPIPPQKSSNVQQSPSSTTMVSPPTHRPRSQDPQFPPNKGVSSYQRSPCHDVMGSGDQIFNSPPQVSSVPKLTHPPGPPPSHLNKPVNDSSNQRSRNSIYSADNFVQPSRNSDSRSQPNSSISNSANSFGRHPADASNESFNFTSIGLNLTSSTSTNSMPVSNSSNSATPFSFSLTPVTSTTVTTTTTSSSSMPGHPHHPQFSLYPFHPPVSVQQGGPPPTSQGQGNMLPLGMDLRLDGSGPPRHPPNNMQGQGFFGLMDMNSRTNIPPEASRINMQEKGSHSYGANVSAQKRHGNISSSRQLQGSSQPLDHGTNSQRSPHVNSAASYYPPNFQSCTAASLHTAPLHHPPTQSGESSRLAHPRTPYDSPFPGAPPQAMGPPFPNRYDAAQPFNRSCNPGQPFEHSSNQSQSESRKSGSKGSKPQQTPPLTHPQSQIPASPQSHIPNSQNSSSCASQPQQQMPQPQQVRSQKRKQSKKNSKQQQQQPNYNCDMDTNLSHSIFDSNQGIASYFQIPNLPPSPSRNMSNEGPSFLPGNIFGAGGRPISNSGPGMHKNAELGPPFNSLFPPARAQNGLGLNFQHPFGMNHGNTSNAAQLGSHSGLAPHMPNFSLGNLNFLSEVNSGGQNDSLNISPIKFPHGNSILPQGGMDQHTLQHAHQGSSLYHQRGQPQPPHVINTMSINSILGHNPHGFDVRPMGQPMNGTPSFHGAPGHPGGFSMPALNLHAMHEH